MRQDPETHYAAFQINSKPPKGLQQWIKSTFGIIQDRIKQFSCDIEQIQRLPPTNQILEIEASLQLIREKLLASKETYWKQKSRGKYIQEGDRNTKFFHSTTICRRKAHGDWTNDSNDIATTLACYFEYLLSNNSTTIPIPHGLVASVISEQDNCHLISIPTTEEIKDSLFSIGSLKDSGPYGFPSIFYEHSWEEIKQNVKEMPKFFSSRPMTYHT